MAFLPCRLDAVSFQEVFESYMRDSTCYDRASVVFDDVGTHIVVFSDVGFVPRRSFVVQLVKMFSTCRCIGIRVFGKRGAFHASAISCGRRL